MCGILGSISHRNVTELILKGLETLEYRGYDSAGIFVRSNDSHHLCRTVGATRELRARLDGRLPEGTLGIGHTRWATHGKPSERNAHPHPCGNVYIVHNGIIENTDTLRKWLSNHTSFLSDTDTETIGRLIDLLMTRDGLSLLDATRAALPLLEGSYSFLATTGTGERSIVAVQNGLPLLAGMNAEGEIVFSSDMSAFPDGISTIVALKPGDVVCFGEGRDNGETYREFEKTRERLSIERSGSEHEGKGFYPTYMFKEICEQPKVLQSLLCQTIVSKGAEFDIAFPENIETQLSRVRRILIVGCGTSYHAGLLGKYMIESLGEIPVEVEIGSEFRYRDPYLGSGDLLLAITQSGETADTLGAIRMANEKGIPVISIVNVPGSSAVRESTASFLLQAGPEFGVASTKTFLAQIGVMTLFALKLAKRIESKTGMSRSELLQEFRTIPILLEKILDLSPRIQHLAERLKGASSALFLGRGLDYPLALEGALKLKEISYVHAEGFAAGELKHGPLALIEEGLPVVALSSPSRTEAKMESNLKEVQSRQGRIVVFGYEGCEESISSLASDTILLPKVHSLFFPMLMTVPLQLFAHHMACGRGFDVDRPRNLAKSVTVE